MHHIHKKMSAFLCFMITFYNGRYMSSVRMLGVELPGKKLVWVGLTNVYGIGKKTALDICQALEIAMSDRVHQLTESQTSKISDYITANYLVEGSLRRDIKENIDRLKHIRCRRGIRLQSRLPVRGQRSKSNARTAKGKAGSTSIKKKKK